MHHDFPRPVRHRPAYNSSAKGGPGVKYLLIMVALLTLPACGVNEWEMSYRTLSEQRSAPLPEEAPIQLVDCSTYADELYLSKVNTAEAEATSLGYSNFEINRTRSATTKIKSEYVPELETFARSIGADYVIYRISYVDTTRGREVDSYETPRTDTSYITTTGRGPDGKKSRYTTTVTTTSWETRLITRTVSIDRFTASAAYFRRDPR